MFYYKVNESFFSSEIKQNFESITKEEYDIFFEKSLEELKQLKINQADSNCQNYILSVYPYYKQLNIINPLFDYTSKDKEEMNTFINYQREKFYNIQKQINNCNSKEELDLININFKNE